MKTVRLLTRYERTARDPDRFDRPTVGQLAEYCTATLYNPGEIAGFPDDEANALIAAGTAVEVPSTIKKTRMLTDYKTRNPYATSEARKGQTK